MFNVPTVAGRARWRRETMRAGLSLPGQAALIAALLADLEEAAPANLAAQRDLITDYADRLTAAEAAAGTDQDDEDLAPLAARVGEIEAVMRAAGGRYAGLLAERQYWVDMAPVLAARHFLHAMEEGGETQVFPARGGMIDEAVLDALAPAELDAVLTEAIGLVTLSDATRKNSAPSSPSPSAPASPEPETMTA